MGRINKETFSANYGTHSCLIPALESFEMGASANRFEVKCFLSAAMTGKFELVLVLEIGILLRTGERCTRAKLVAVDAFRCNLKLGLFVCAVVRIKQWSLGNIKTSWSV